jgi:hypothetical protein
MNIPEESNMGIVKTTKVQVVSTLEDVSWGIHTPAYLMKINTTYVTVRENDTIYHIPWSTICYIKEAIEESD